jgi:cytochrome c oxidase assembly protein subunit 15
MLLKTDMETALIERSRWAKWIGWWLMAGVCMIVVQVVLGGITRLSGSGLSITEWEVITGTLPPLSEKAWLGEFEKYKDTPQFRLLNADFSLADFKFIYFWEWFHRLWARFIGIVFAVGFFFFLIKKAFTPDLQKGLAVLFVLGSLQGAVGWIMVASGLTGDAVYVKPTRLALHFILALGLLCYTYLFALRLSPARHNRIHHPGLRNLAFWALGILFVQLLYGALMAGHKAATAAATWPSINGYLATPPGLWQEGLGNLNLIENKITIHFVHRLLAYALVIALAMLSWRAHRSQQLNARSALAPGLLVLMQAVLGIFTVLASKGIIPNVWGVFEWLALSHQVVGMLLLLSLVHFLYLTSGGKKKHQAVHKTRENLVAA